MEYNRKSLERMVIEETLPQSSMKQGDNWVIPFISGSEACVLEAVPPGLYFMMQHDGTLKRCMEGRASENLNDFVRFMSRPDLSLLICYDGNPSSDATFTIDNSQRAVMGAFWLSSIVQAAEGKRGTLGFFFAREYWQPRRTELVGRMALNLFFNALEIDLITTWCLSEDRMARRYLTRLGFKRVAEVPDYGKWGLVSSSGLLWTIHKKDFNSPWGDEKISASVESLGELATELGNVVVH